MDARGGTALVGECGGRIVAFAGYYRAADDPDRAEVAFAIADAFQGRGIGTRLLEQLANLARAERVRTFDAYVLGENRKMMDVLLESGYRVSRRIEGGVFHVELVARAHARIRREGRQTVAAGGDGVDERLLRASNSCGSGCQP